MEYQEGAAEKQRQQLAVRVSVVCTAVNLLLAAFKFAAGIWGKSSAMISDGVDSATDAISAVAVSAGVRMARKKSDQNHQYGHERLECIVSILLAMGLFLTGGGIGLDAASKIIRALSGNAEVLSVPTLLPLIAAMMSIAVKLWLYCFTRAAARKMDSPALMANAWNYRSDVFSSLGSLAAIAGARLGLPILDPVASAVICLLILKAAYEICRDAINQMVDASCDETTNEGIRKVVLSVEGVRGVDLLMTRLFGSRFYVDIEIAVDGEQTLSQAHRIAEQVHDAVESSFPGAKHCMVHMNPYEERKDGKKDETDKGEGTVDSGS